jgi:hypothetical protein
VLEEINGMTTLTKPAIAATHVRYIKLGAGGGWEKECIASGRIRIGFHTERPDRFGRCQAGQWDTVAASYIAEGKGKAEATNFTNQLQWFFEDDGTTLWVTFVDEHLYWGFVASGQWQQSPDGAGVYKTMRDGWQCTDLVGGQLTTDGLPKTLTTLMQFRGTSCKVHQSDYVIRRINGDTI